MTQHSRTLRREFVHWLSLNTWHSFLTLNFNQPTSTVAMRTDFRHFCQRVDRKILGPKYYDRQGQRTIIVALPEHIETNGHLHCLLLFRRPHTVRMREAKTVCLSSWKEVNQSGTAQLQDIPRRYTLAEYVTKELSKTGHYEIVMLSSEFWPAGIH